MPDTVKVPILGTIPKGGALAGLLAVVGVGGYLVYKHYVNKGATGAAAGAYGYGYGAYGAATTVPSAYGYGYIPYGSYGFGGGGGYPYPYSPGPFPTGSGYGAITTNAQWGQAAESALGSTGTDATAAAIAKYLAGAPISQDQALLVQEAEAVVGPPPQAGLAGYPPKMHVHQKGSKHPKRGQTAHNPVTGLHVAPRTTQADISWHASQGAHSYRVRVRSGNVAGNRPVDQQDTTGTHITIHNLHPKTRYEVNVLADPAASNARMASAHFTTK